MLGSLRGYISKAGDLEGEDWNCVCGSVRCEGEGRGRRLGITNGRKLKSSALVSFGEDIKVFSPGGGFGMCCTAVH